MFVPLDAFERQMEHLARRRTVVPLEGALRPVDAPSPPVAITFDDAYRNFVEVALPVIERYRLPVTLFVPSGKLGGANTWDASSSCERDLMTRADVEEVARRGVAIESHGHMHVDLSAAPVDTIRADLAASAEALTEITGTPPRFLAYPWGRHDERVRGAAAEAGFVAAFAVNAGSGDEYGIERVQVEADDAPWRYALKTSGLYGRLRSLVR